MLLKADGELEEAVTRYASTHMEDNELDEANDLMDNLDIVLKELEYLVAQSKILMDNARWERRQEEIRARLQTILQQ